jgi:hypothetical protein
MTLIQTIEQVHAVGDSSIRELMLARIAELSDEADDFSEIVNFAVIAGDDDLQQLEERVRSPLTSPPSDYRRADVWEEHEGAYELVYVLSDDGFGVAVFIPKSCVPSPRLLGLIRENWGGD